MKKVNHIIIIIVLGILLVGCKKNIDLTDDGSNLEPTATITPTVTPQIIEPIEEETREGEVRSFYTGEWLEEELAYNRPYAIQFSNYKTVRNQWGISEADVLFEAMVEGGITRIVGIGQNFKSERIGSVRSARHYYANFVDTHNAIYIHFGKTKYATSQFNKLKINNIDGTTGIGDTVFYRTKDLKAPHNAFTSLERIQKGIERKEFDTLLAKDYKGLYSFYKEDTDIQGDVAKRLDIKFSSYNSPYYEYKEDEKMYYRYQFNEEHKDSNTGEQLSFKNIIVQFVKEWDIDKNGYQTMAIEDAKGEGYYITNGKIQKITWAMNENDKNLSYFDSEGKDLFMNSGKTFVELFPDKRTSDVTFE